MKNKDGTMSKLAIKLDNTNPHQILERMVEAIDFPLPPSPVESSSLKRMQIPHLSRSQRSIPLKSDVDHLIWANWWGSHLDYKSPNSTKRDVLHFLENMDFDHIKQRKLARINATASALVARRAFKFLAIDGTKLGWSSSSLAICLSRLTSLHEEHQSRLQTKSFYPFRLLLSSDEFLRKVDLFSGTIRLNPASTSLKWLDTLASVTDVTVSMMKNHQQDLMRNLAKVEDALGLRVVKGHTCDPEEYHQSIELLGFECNQNGKHHGDRRAVLNASQSVIFLESDHACRHGKIRTDGKIAIGTGMTLNEIRSTIASFASRSNDYMRIESENQTKFKASADQFMREFGVQKVSKMSSLVTSEQMIECLSVLLKKEETEKDVLRRYLAGPVSQATVTCVILVMMVRL